MARDPRRFDDLFADFGPVDLRRLFGGEGVFANGVIIGIVHDDHIYLKTDGTSRKAYLAEGCKPFVVTKRRTGERLALSYYAVPDRLYDDPAELADWARAALVVSQRSPNTVKKRRKKAVRHVRG